LQGKLIENTLAYKSKQIFFVLVKLIVVVAAFYMIYLKVIKNDGLAFSDFKNALFKSDVVLIKSLILLFTLSIANWCLEILKWQQLAKLLRPISFFESCKQCLFSLTASLITPNRIGDYGAKALFYKKEQFKKCMALNFLGHSSQLSITIFFGVFGLLYLITHFSFNLALTSTQKITIIAVVIFLIGIAIWITTKKAYYLKKIVLQKPLIFKTLGFSLLRYVVFSFQFYFLLHLFHFNIMILEAFAFTSAMYILASVIPALSVFDVVIKGSISVYLFGLLGYNPMAVLSIVLIMWLLNFALPALIGSYFVITFKPKSI
jgi:hypothetical protein